MIRGKTYFSTDNIVQFWEDWRENKVWIRYRSEKGVWSEWKLYKRYGMEV